VSWSQLLLPLPPFPRFLTEKIPSYINSRIPPLMYPVFLVIPLPTDWDILRVSLDCGTNSPCWVYTKYPHTVTGFVDEWLGCSGVHHMSAVLSACTVPPLSPTLWCRDTFWASTIAPLSFLTSLLIHGTPSVCVDHPLLCISTQCTLTCLPAVHSYCTYSRVFHEKEVTS